MSLIGRDITVIGAGVAGLCVARALALRGARITVLEQAPQITEVGAGIQISPNGGRVLEALGLGKALEQASSTSQAVVLRDHLGAEVLRMDLGGHGRFALVHRADLIDLLAEGAREAGVTVETGIEVTQVLPGDPYAIVQLADGTRREASLVVGADGLHSHVRSAIEGTGPATFTGQVAWRALIEASDIPAEAQVFMGPGRHVVVYPLRQGRLLNIVAIEERQEWAEEGWHHQGSAEDMRHAFKAFGDPVQSWLAAVKDPMVWGLFRHPVAKDWFAPGAVLCGDAAHPTLPFLAQGACMALEDAWALAEALAQNDSDAAAFSAYRGKRRPRVKRIVEAANANARNYHLKGPSRLVAHTGLRLMNATAPQRVLSRFDWLYNYDVTAA